MGIVIGIIREIIRLSVALFIATLLMFTFLYYSPVVCQDSVKEDKKPLLIEYHSWMKNIIFYHDLGKTRHGEEVLKEVLSRGKNSLFLIFLALLISIVFTGIFLFLLGHIKSPLFCRGVRLIFYMFSAFPAFILSYILLEASSNKLIAFNITGEVAWYHYIVPVLILGISDGFLCEMVKHSYSEIERIENEPYIRMVKAKGVNLLRHIKYDFIIHISQLISLQIVFLISGTVIIEYIFNLPGIGSLAFDAAEYRDINLLLGILMLIVVIVIVTNCINRILALALDPRLQKNLIVFM